MTPFVRLEALAAPLMEENVDTDIIFPARFLLITAREGLGRYAFHDRRFTNDEGRERDGFVLNQKPWNEAQVLIAGDNFGSGSSREQAVWALSGFGIRCVVAPSFGEIFQANCIRNGVLPIVLAPATVLDLAALAATGLCFTVDLETQTILVGDRQWTFAIPPEQRLAMLNGWDDTAMILNTRGSEIERYEDRQRLLQPWLWEHA